MKMKNLYKIIGFFGLTYFLLSCNERSKIESSTNKIIFDVTKSVNIGLKESKKIDKETIALTFADSIVIPAYSNLLTCCENNIIIYSQKTFQVFRFDGKGHFINFIGKRGGGPGEFSEMRDVSINYQNDTIIEILDRESILRYQLDGNFIEKIKIKYPAFSFAIDNNNYWFYIGNNPSFSQYKLIQTDTYFTQKNEFFKISEKGVPLVENNFNKGKYITFRESLYPKLYTLNDQLNNSYYVDFEKFKIPDAVLSLEQMNMMEELEKLEYATIRTYLENKNYTFLFIMKYNPSSMLPSLYYLIINKNTKEEKLMHVEDFHEDSFLLYPQLICDNDIIYFIGYDLENMDESINPNSNPSIIKIKIEAFFSDTNFVD